MVFEGFQDGFLMKNLTGRRAFGLCLFGNKQKKKPERDLKRLTFSESVIF